ncbi:hypothetical protein AADR41_25915 [Streptomyces sp. CLV115]|uniref:hypothetical protein n=1 Tax=Streptomyces sp. CLV115 TaxID=3138502 RepID=UPI00313D950F
MASAQRTARARASVTTRFVRTCARLGPSGLGRRTVGTGTRDVVHALHITNTWNF